MTKIIFKICHDTYLCRVKSIFVIVISIIMFAKPFWPVVDYMVNYDYIVNVLCENKDEPEMECNGKCYLGKELAKEQGDSDANPFSGKTSKTEIPLVIISEKISDFTFRTESEIGHIQEAVYRPVLHISLFTSKILHPPQLG